MIIQDCPTVETTPASQGNGPWLYGCQKVDYSLIYDRMPYGSQLTDPKQTSHYLECDPTPGSELSACSTRSGFIPHWCEGIFLRRNDYVEPRHGQVKAVAAYFGIGWINYYRDRECGSLITRPKIFPKVRDKTFFSAMAPQAHAPHKSHRAERIQ